MPAPPVPKDDEPPEVVQFLTGAAAETALDALLDEKSAWQVLPGGAFFYGDPAGTYIAWGDPRMQRTADDETRELDWSNILQLDDAHAQTFLYVMTRDLASNDSSKKTRVHVNEILAYKGFKRHVSGDFRPEHKREELARLYALNSMWIAVSDVIKVNSGRGHKKKQIKLYSRVIDLDIEIDEGASAPAAASASMPLPFIPPTSVPYAVRIGLGGWSTEYRAVPEYVRAVLARVVQYDATQESQRYAMRFVLTFMFSGERKKRWKLRELLEKSRIALPLHHADRFRDLVEKTFELLEKDEIIGPWDYANTTELPKKRWLQEWLEWEVAFTPPASAIPDSPRRIASGQ
jgi:hypothetical protein